MYNIPTYIIRYVSTNVEALDLFSKANMIVQAITFTLLILGSKLPC